MRDILGAAGLFVLTLAGCAEQRTAQPTENDIADAREAAAALGGTLKARLLAAMAQGGPAAAVEICNEAAPEIAAAVSMEKNLIVGRTALRLRNPENAPDEWERRQLEKFLAAMEGGADPANLEAAEIVVANGQKTFRWMKPIITEGPCTICHGETIADEVKAAILARYPQDEATGFGLGELRGAFTISKALPADE